MRIKLLKKGVFISGKNIPDKISKYSIPYRNGMLISHLAFLYMIEKGQLPVKYDFQTFLYRIKRHDRKIFSKYLIFRDLMERGYFVEDGYGKGIDLLVYNKGDYPNKSPTIRIMGIEEGEYIKIKNILNELYFSSLNKKHLVIAVIERRGEVIYYLISRFGDL